MRNSRKCFIIKNHWSIKICTKKRFAFANKTWPAFRKLQHEILPSPQIEPHSEIKCIASFPHSTYSESSNRNYNVDCSCAIIRCRSRWEFPQKKRDCSEHAFTIIEQQENMSRTVEPIAVEEKKEFKNRRWFRSAVTLSAEFQWIRRIIYAFGLVYWIYMSSGWAKRCSSGAHNANFHFTVALGAPSDYVRSEILSEFWNLVTYLSSPFHNSGSKSSEWKLITPEWALWMYRNNDKICFRCKISFPRSPRATEI